MRRALLLGAVLVALGGCGSESRVDQVVDEIEENGSLVRFCRAYNDAGRYVSDRDAVGLAQFKRTYNSDDPPAEEVYPEIVSRC